MYKNLIINYARNITKEDIENFVKSNNIKVSKKDINTIYEYIKKYYLNFFDNPIGYIKMLKGKIENDVYYEILTMYDNYKKYL